MANTHSQENNNNNISYEKNNAERYLIDKLLLAPKSAYFTKDEHHV